MTGTVYKYAMDYECDMSAMMCHLRITSVRRQTYCVRERPKVEQIDDITT